MGLAFCLLFAWWFLSGIFMLYCDFPQVDSASRLERSPVLDASQVRLSALEAFARLQRVETPGQVRLNTFDGRPVYRFDDGEMVYADTGERPVLSSPEMSLRTASAWTGQPSTAAKTELNTVEDQWTVHESFGRLRPMRKYSWPNGEQVYVSLVSGEVVQYTTTTSRLGAYLGPIPHWLYFTPLRKHTELWTRIVIWSSGLATLAALFGLLAGVLFYSPSQRYRRQGTPTSIPFAGAKRWHTILGLFFGFVACTWSFSGMLSMDPFSMEAGDDGAAVLDSALRGGHFKLSAFSAKHPRDALGQLQLMVKELEFTFFAGEAVYLATGAQRNTTIIPVNGMPAPTFEIGRLMEAIGKAKLPAGLAELRLVQEYDAYYLDRHRLLPLPVLLAQLNDPDKTRYYVDPRTARVVGSYSSRSWVDRWLYHGLHSIDLPFLYNHRPAWDGVVLTLLFGCTSLAVTSVILGYRLLRRKLRARAAYL
jgi:uncharacterized membrane protein